MKKLSRWKKQKIDAIETIMDFTTRSCYNRFTKVELKEAIGKIELETSQDVEDLLRYCFDNFRTIKLNFHKFLVNIKIVRKRDENGYKVNLIHFDIKMNTRKNYTDLRNFRIDMIGELQNMISLNNQLSYIFEDEITQPSLYDDPEWEIE